MSCAVISLILIVKNSSVSIYNWFDLWLYSQELGELDNQADEGEDDSEITQQEGNSETTKHATDEL